MKFDLMSKQPKLDYDTLNFIWDGLWRNNYCNDKGNEVKRTTYAVNEYLMNFLQDLANEIEPIQCKPKYEINNKVFIIVNNTVVEDIISTIQIKKSNDGIKICYRCVDFNWLLGENSVFRTYDDAEKYRQSR